MKKILFLIIIILFIVYIVQSTNELYGLWKKQGLLVQAKLNLQKAHQEHEKLLRQLSIASQPGFVEEQARNKLFLIKPGEYHVLLEPENKTTVNVTVKPLPNWKQWLQRLIY